MGHIFKRGEIYYISYTDARGKRQKESSKSTKISVARALLKRRELEAAQGRLPGHLLEKVKFDELAEGYLTDYKINNRKSLDRAEQSVRRLKEMFEGWQRIHQNASRRRQSQFNNQPRTRRAEKNVPSRTPRRQG
ncbi:MAG: hypothetical protein ACYTEQ_29850 [Planctomycetota bacterium]|jgi:transcription initiation factor TFIID subunit TAF12